MKRLIFILCIITFSANTMGADFFIVTKNGNPKAAGKILSITDEIYAGEDVVRLSSEIYSDESGYGIHVEGDHVLQVQAALRALLPITNSIICFQTQKKQICDRLIFKSDKTQTEFTGL